MANLALDDTIALRACMFAKLATYVAPKRKAVELSGPDGGPTEGAKRHGLLSTVGRRVADNGCVAEKAMGGGTE